MTNIKNSKIQKPSIQKIEIAKQKTNNPWIIFYATMIGVMMVNIDATIVNVALPVIANNYHIQISQVQWVISSYILTACILLPISGRLSDIYTKKVIYLLGFAVFTIGSLLCSIATSLCMLVIFRFIQGIGAAMIMSNNQALIVMNFPEHIQGRALSLNGVNASFGAIVGPALGGFLISALGWRSIFYINIPIGIIGCIIGYRVLPNNEKRLPMKIDVKGSILFAIIITSILLAFDNISDGKFLNWQTGILLLTFLTLGIIFIKQQKITLFPLIDFTLFKNKLYLNSNLSAFIVFMALGGNSILLPFYLHDILHLTPATMGMILFVSPIVMMFLSPISGYCSDKYSIKKLVLFGLCLLCLGLILLGMSTVKTTIWQIVIYQLIIGTGFAFFQPPNNVSLFKNIDLDDFGVASSFNALMRNLGRVFGVVLATSVFSLIFTHILQNHHKANKVIYNHAFFYGFKTAFFILAGFMLLIIYNSCSNKIKE